MSWESQTRTHHRRLIVTKKAGTGGSRRVEEKNSLPENLVQIYPCPGAARIGEETHTSFREIRERLRQRLEVGGALLVLAR